jgi:hypothetical protein
LIVILYIFEIAFLLVNADHQIRYTSTITSGTTQHNHSEFVLLPLEFLKMENHFYTQVGETGEKIQTPELLINFSP